MTSLLRAVGWFVLVTASIGATAALIIGVLSWQGQLRLNEGVELWLPLILGVIVVGFPEMALFQRLKRGIVARDAWKVALHGTPGPLRLFVYVSVAYCILVWAISMVYAFATGDAETINRGVYFSAFALAFYAVAVGVGAAVINMPQSDLDRRCSNGHEVSLVARYCSTCGLEIGMSPNNALERSREG